MTIGVVSATLVAENTFTDSIKVRGWHGFNVSISGIAGDTVTLQRSYDDGVLWKDVESYEADYEDYGFEVERGTLWRIGIKTGDYSAGTVLVRISF